MQTDFVQFVTNFYPDDGNSLLTQVPTALEQGSPYQPDETSDYCDLDMDQSSGSPEQNTSDSSVQSPVIQQSLESFMYDIKKRALNEYRNDVEHTCRCLGIPLDPLRWTNDHVQQWVVWQCGQDKIPVPNMDYFYISGVELCSLNEADFISFAPRSGRQLNAMLICWRNVVEQTMNQTYTNVLPTISTLPVPASCRTSSSGSASPTASSCSENESQAEICSCSENESQAETPPTHSLTYEDDDRLPEEPVQHHRQTIRLWQFLKLLLLDGHYTEYIYWKDRSRGIFKIKDSRTVARLWGKRKNCSDMNYDKLSRSLRQYYRKNIIKKTEPPERLVYQFCQNVL